MGITVFEISGLPKPGQPTQLILNQASEWVRPADLDVLCQRVKFYLKKNADKVGHFFVDTRPERLEVWLKLPPSYQSGDLVVMETGGSYPEYVAQPKDAGLIAAVNLSDPFSIGRNTGDTVWPSGTVISGLTSLYFDNPMFYTDGAGNLNMFFEFGDVADEWVGIKPIGRVQSKDGGITWSTPVVNLYAGGVNVTGHPIHIPGPLWKRSDGKAVMLFFGRDTATTGHIYKVVSTNTFFDTVGNDWGTPEQILGALGIGQVGSPSPMILSDGTWAVYIHRSLGGTWMCYSRDEGYSWKAAYIGGSNLCNEGCGWEYPNEKGHLVCWGRGINGYPSKTFMESHSYDYGRTWTNWVNSKYPMPKSKADAWVTSRKKVLWAYNDHEIDPLEDAGKRANLCIRISDDGGYNFNRRFRLGVRHTGSAAADPAVYEAPDGGLYAANTIDKTSLHFRKYSAEELARGNHNAVWGNQNLFFVPNGGAQNWTAAGACILGLEELRDTDIKFPLDFIVTARGRSPHQGQANIFWLASIRPRRGVVPAEFGTQWVAWRRTWTQSEVRHFDSVGGGKYTVLTASWPNDATETMTVRHSTSLALVTFIRNGVVALENVIPYNNDATLVGDERLYCLILGNSAWTSTASLPGSNPSDYPNWNQIYSAVIVSDPFYTTAEVQP